ncbi:ricin-type beta-trefoil lectin domain containing protein [Entamoeba histolytica HM-1:IMSS-B]|uniref:Ricin B lectin domain-containing protein n=6 Tax=Entamoeba histolytica TaxID=5759 RepID=C4MAF3_ENTH1|nr:uncharacterized protein EHI_167330 [Entamoeba histolytica HM-1:IMSS]EMD44223.1 ricintype beta-trefoil lectin domain containing protein [Entamoeba histolytica KU27]EMH73936.1 ricin-type beta-trefoil lectin domain containing protein [Entamoeba histolytica HM-1:IMSS-B]EMS16590.1 ricin-type beta-trefoil lectin domain containing protein [Entamoeba histolytica HM-3:IMSS]ENY59823.1 ricin-type beta-trefoil lectin domain containing protein [Entamoeba histolytica HM-1:IMSS-A]GAT98780.1 hypothetical p|eukprot:XP_650369.1 uncharacterized protein EHI_167330 [Entamoeba histolytica HM-1:IMSS]
MNGKQLKYQFCPKNFSNFALDICGGGEYRRAPLVIFDNNGNTSQLFYYQDGYLINKKSHLALSASSEDDPERIEVIQSPQRNQAEQLWKIYESNKKGCVIWSVKYPTLCMTVEEGNYSDDTSIILQQYDKSGNQRFVINCK